MITTDSAVQSETPAHDTILDEWFNAYSGVVSEVSKELLQEANNNGQHVLRIPSSSQSKVELEVIDPSFLSIAQVLLREYTMGIESYVEQYINDKKDYFTRSDNNSVCLILPARSAIVTSIKVAMTRISPAFDQLMPTLVNWHEFRCIMGRWLWKESIPLLKEKILNDVFNDTNINLRFIFNLNDNDERPVMMDERRLYDIMWAVIGPACVALDEYCLANHTSSDHMNIHHSHYLLDQFFLHYLAQRIIALVNKISMEKAHEVIRREDELDFRKRRKDDEEEERPRGKRRAVDKTGSESLRDYLNNIAQADLDRMKNVSLPAWVLPTELKKTDRVSDVLRWKPPEYTSQAANFYKMPADPHSLNVALGDFDWHVVVQVLKFIRDRGISTLVSTQTGMMWQISELDNIAEDPSQPVAKKTFKKKKHRGQDGSIVVGGPDPINHLWTIDELKLFLEGKMPHVEAESDEENDPYKLANLIEV